MMYAIIIPGKKERYINWCDEHWYETTREKRFIFTKEECETIYKQMLDHYVLSLIFEGEDGTKELREWKSRLHDEVMHETTSEVMSENNVPSFKKMSFKVR